MARKQTAALQRLISKLVIDGDCWRFTGALTGGYGVIGRGGRGAGNVYTHRLTYEHFIGPIPEGLDIDHLCRNRWCCNPRHLEAVPRIVNVARGLRGPGYGPRERSHCKWGHPYSGDNLVVTPKQRKCRACMREYGRRKAELARAAKTNQTNLVGTEIL